jgi:hypothetical protein
MLHSIRCRLVLRRAQLSASARAPGQARKRVPSASLEHVLRGGARREQPRAAEAWSHRRLAELRGMRCRGERVTPRSRLCSPFRATFCTKAAGALYVAPAACSLKARNSTGAVFSGLSSPTVRALVERFRSAGAIVLEPPRARLPCVASEAELNAMEPAVKAWVEARFSGVE